MQEIAVESVADRYDPIEVLPPRLVASMLGRINTSTLWRMRQRGEFPEPIHITGNRCGWMRRDVEAWLNERAKAGRSKTPPRSGL